MLLRPGMLCKPRCNKKVLQFKRVQLKWAQMSYKWLFPIKTELSAPNNDWVTYLVFNNKTINYGQQKLWHEPKLTITIIKAVQVVKCKPLINYIYSELQWAQKYYQSDIWAAQTDLFNTTLTTLLFEPKDYKSTTLWKTLQEQSKSYRGKQV